MNKDDVAVLVERLDAVGTRDNPVEFYGLAGLAKDALTTLSAENEALQARVDVLEAALRRIKDATTNEIRAGDKGFVSRYGIHGIASKALEGKSNGE